MYNQQNIAVKIDHISQLHNQLSEKVFLRDNVPPQTVFTPHTGQIFFGRHLVQKKFRSVFFFADNHTAQDRSKHKLKTDNPHQSSDRME